VRTNLGFATFTADDIEESKQPFVSTPQAVAVIANRYDGIDFPGAPEDWRLGSPSMKSRRQSLAFGRVVQSFRSNSFVEQAACKGSPDLLGVAAAGEPYYL
jgi:hypothetical protein